jgi:hypothetical protein
MKRREFIAGMRDARGVDASRAEGLIEQSLQ